MKNVKSWYFLGIMMVLYSILFFVNRDIFQNSILFFHSILLKIVPVFIFVFAMMVLVNRYITHDFVFKHIQANKWKSWLYVVLGGILASGPAYLWYPFLETLRSKGVHNGMLACFIYNRSIILPFFPVLVFYFGWRYSITLTLTLILASFVQAFFIEKVLPTNQVSS